jgi:hypothetical protein
MPDKEFIHSAADVTQALSFALASGFQIRLDAPKAKAEQRFLQKEEIGTLGGGVFLLLRPEWVYGEPQIAPIPRGHNAGLYTVSPGVNQSPITLYFGGERIDRGRRRFGAGTVSYHRDWLELPARVVRETPPEVAAWFKRITAHLLSQGVIHAGAHKYYLCKGVNTDPSAPECLPPFDYIPWNKGVISSIVS